MLAVMYLRAAAPVCIGLCCEPITLCSCPRFPFRWLRFTNCSLLLHDHRDADAGAVAVGLRWFGAGCVVAGMELPTRRRGRGASDHTVRALHSAWERAVADHSPHARALVAPVCPCSVGSLMVPLPEGDSQQRWTPVPYVDIPYGKVVQRRQPCSADECDQGVSDVFDALWWWCDRQQGFEGNTGDEECPVCLERCVQPFRLPCGHVFCFLCIKVTGCRSTLRSCAPAEPPRLAPDKRSLPPHYPLVAVSSCEFLLNRVACRRILARLNPSATCCHSYLNTAPILWTLRGLDRETHDAQCAALTSLRASFPMSWCRAKRWMAMSLGGTIRYYHS